MSPPSHLTHGVVRLMDFAILQFARISPTFVALHRFPSSQRPCFPRMASQRSGSSSPSSGNRYNSATAGASCWSPRTWHMEGNLGLRAEDAAPRSNAPRDSGRQERVRPRQEARLVGPALCRLLCNPAKEPTQASTTRLVRSALRQHVENLPTSRSAFKNTLREQPAQASVLPLSFFLVLPARLELCPRACILESRPRIFSDEQRPFAEGFMGPRAIFLLEGAKPMVAGPR